MASKVGYKHYWNDVLVITIRACLYKDFSSWSFLIRTQIHWLRWFPAGCWHFNWAFSNIYFQLKECGSIRMKSKKQNETNWFPLNEISEIYFQTVLDSVKMITVVSVKLAPFCAHTDSNFGTTPKAWSIENWNEMRNRKHGQKMHIIIVSFTHARRMLYVWLMVWSFFRRIVTNVSRTLMLSQRHTTTL